MTTDNTRFRRRTVLKVAGGGLTLGGYTGLASAQRGADELARQLTGVRAATREYRDVTTARDDGYSPVGLGYLPGQGFHFTDSWPPFGSEREDPPMLVYFTTGSYEPDPGDQHDPAHDDDLILGGVEYLLPGDMTDEPPDIFADESSPRELQVTEADGWHYEGDEDGVGIAVTSLHVWVHRGNPAGVFHRTNPIIE